jgi:hypothetical protein
MKDQTRKWLQIANGIAVMATIIMNILANALPLNGKFTGELSDQYPNLFVPAGITFSIWGVIYVLLIVFAVYQGRDLFHKTLSKMDFIQKIGPFFLLASIANILWIFFWHYEQVGLALIAMTVLLISLILIYLRLDIGRKPVPLKEKLCVQVPFSVYLGWITVATVANITALLVSISWDGLGISEILWTQLLIAIVVLLTILILFLRKDIAYTLVVVWALAGIAIKRLQDDPIYGIQSSVAYTAEIAIIILAGALIAIIAFTLRKQRAQHT